MEMIIETSWLILGEKQVLPGVNVRRLQGPHKLVPPRPVSDGRASVAVHLLAPTQQHLEGMGGQYLFPMCCGVGSSSRAAIETAKVVTVPKSNCVRVAPALWVT